MHPFRSYIASYQVLNEKEWEMVEQCITRKELQKGTKILTEGEMCTKLYFLESGFLKYYSLKDGEEVTKFFTKPPYCFTSQRSFSNDLPSEESIEVLVDAEIWEMDKKDAFDLLRMYGWSEFIRKLILEVQYQTEQILEDIQNFTAEERYVKMLEESNPILLNAPLKDIASFLGIAPQSLSRIRKKYWLSQQKLT